MKQIFNGFLNINKPPGISSSQVVGAVKKYLNTSKVGHAGTLDPLASGVLPIMLGRATKLFDYLQYKDKTYIAEVFFGKTTNTLDSDGEVIAKSNNIPSDFQIDAVLSQFLGKQNQIPPIYSALKYEGKRLYQMAREGNEIEIKPRSTEIFELEKLSNISNNKCRILIRAKSGFYVRSFCRDLGKALDTCAYMSFLLRTNTGNFNIKNTISIENLVEYAGDINDYILPMDFPLKHLKEIHLDKNFSKAIKNGVSISTKYFEYNSINNNDIFRVYCNNEFIGLGKIKESMLKIETLLSI
ncbi:MAG: tRNA pseudouridine(55) synthase TruB [Christensenellaceae bacterium]|nr:tRNA pseudouridine(55) synthase TruB [Christensenellaceae bacterium]